MIKFISYTGKYPNLCSGVLTVDIDGKTVKFGHNSLDYDYKSSKYNDDSYDKFWSSGGCCGFRNDYSESYVERSEWRFSYDADKVIPDWIDKEELLKVFSENVEFGCCGGCL